MGTAGLLSFMSSIIIFSRRLSSYLLYAFFSLSFSHRFLLIHHFLLLSFLLSSSHLSCPLSVTAIAHGSISPWSFKGSLTPPYMSPTRENFLPTFPALLAVTLPTYTRRKWPRRLPSPAGDEESLSYSKTLCSTKRNTTAWRDQPNNRHWLKMATEVPLPPLGLLVSPDGRFSRPRVRKKRKEFSLRRESVSLSPSSSYALNELQSSIQMPLPSRLSLFTCKSFKRHSSVPYHSQVHRPNPSRRQRVSYIPGFIVFSTLLKRRKSSFKGSERSYSHLSLASSSYDAAMSSLTTARYPAQHPPSQSTPLSSSRSFSSSFSSSTSADVDSTVIAPPRGFASLNYDSDRHVNFSSSLSSTRGRGEEEEDKKVKESVSTSSYQAKRKSRIQEEDGRDHDFYTPRLKNFPPSSLTPRSPRPTSSSPSPSYPYRSRYSHEDTPDRSCIPSSVPSTSDRSRASPSRGPPPPGFSSRQHHQRHPSRYEGRDSRHFQRENVSQDQESFTSYPSPSPPPCFPDSQSHIDELQSFFPHSFSSPSRRRKTSSSSPPLAQASSQASGDSISPQRYRHQQRLHVADDRERRDVERGDEEEFLLRMPTRGEEGKRLVSSSFDGRLREEFLLGERRRHQRSSQRPHGSLPLSSPSLSSYESHEKNVLRKEAVSLRSTPSGAEARRLVKKEGEKRGEHEDERRTRSQPDSEEMIYPSHHRHHGVSQRLQRPSSSSLREESLQLLDWMLQQNIELDGKRISSIILQIDADRYIRP